MHSKSQSSFEFLLLVGVMFFAVILVVGATYSNIAALAEKRGFLMVKDMAHVIQNELVLAAQVEDGYARSFLIPEKLGNRPYTLVVINNSLTVSTDEASYAVRIPRVQGSPAKGVNNITKIDNVVVLNNG
jgi:hypothetical protein